MTAQCNICGKVTTADSTTAKWRRDSTHICGVCWDRTRAGLKPGDKRPRCAACGRVAELTSGQCEKCNEAGHVALSLFGEK